MNELLSCGCVPTNDEVVVDVVAVAVEPAASLGEFVNGALARGDVDLRGVRVVAAVAVVAAAVAVPHDG